jgi:hypothetical protein
MQLGSDNFLHNNFGSGTDPILFSDPYPYPALDLQHCCGYWRICVVCIVGIFLNSLREPTSATKYRTDPVAVVAQL